MPAVSAGVTVPIVLSDLSPIYGARLLLLFKAVIATLPRAGVWCTAVLERQRHRLGDTAKSEVVQGRPALYATRLGNFFL